MPYSNKNYLLIRIVNYFLVVLLVIINKSIEKTSLFMLLLSLAFILNSQCRVLYFNKNNKIFSMSLIAEFLLLYIFMQNYGFITLTLVFSTVLDIILFYKKKISLMILAVLFMSAIALIVNSQSMVTESLTEIFAVTVMILVVLLIGYLMKKEIDKKIDAQDLYDKLRKSEQKLQKAYEELERYSSTIEELTLLRERTRISRELHDSVGHNLSTLIIQLQAIKSLVLKQPQKAIHMLEHINDFTKQALENVRNAVRQLKPIEFEKYQGIFTIEELINNFSKLTNVKVKLIVSKNKWKLNSMQTHNLYRIIQEALSNSLRHGKSKNVVISFQFLEKKLYVRISDDGIGCDKINRSFGLKGITERVKELNGNIEIISIKDQGFEISFELPFVEGN